MWEVRCDDSTEGKSNRRIVLANFANQTHEAYAIGLPEAGSWKVRFNSDWGGYDAEFSNMDSFGMEARAGTQDGYEWQGSIPLAPYSTLILSREN